jgi:hypothetical protein
LYIVVKKKREVKDIIEELKAKINGIYFEIMSKKRQMRL